jgi:hypothetical protein
LSIPGSHNLKICVYINNTSKILIFGNFIDSEFETRDFKLELKLDSCVRLDIPATIHLSNGIATISLTRGDDEETIEMEIEIEET